MTNNPSSQSTEQRVALLIERGHVDPKAIATLMVNRDAEHGDVALATPEADELHEEYAGCARSMLRVDLRERS